MDYIQNLRISEFQTGMMVEGYYILKEASQRTTTAG